MMYYIDSPDTWRAANRKCAEVQEFVNKFKNCLIVDELSRDAMVGDIRQKVDELNQAYPRTKKLVVIFDHKDHIFCHPEGRATEYENVFIIRILPVRRTYQFAESTAVLEEGGAQ